MASTRILNISCDIGRMSDLATPIYDDEIRERIDSMFEIMIKDDEKGKILNKKGLYEDRQINECKLNSQELFYKVAYGEITLNEGN